VSRLRTKGHGEMGIGLQLRSQLLKVFFVLAACFALGLVTSGVVAGAGPLAALSS
jgi:hypothetical protein